MTITTANTGLLERAHERMGVPDAEAHRDHIDERLSVIRMAIQPDDRFVTDLYNELRTGGLADDAEERAAAHRRSNADTMATLELFTELRERAVNGVEKAHRDRADAGLEVVRVELGVVLEAARGVLADLGDVVDAEHAIDEGRVGAFDQARRLASRYAEVRAAQRELVENARPQATDTREVVAAFGIVRDADQYDVDIREFLVQARSPRRAHSLTGASIDPIVLPWHTGDPLADLRFAVREDVVAWCPTLRELRDEQATIMERTRPDETDERSAAQQWRDRGEPPLSVRPATAWAAQSVRPA